MKQGKTKRKTTSTKILDYLSEHEPSSRLEICRGLNLAESTVRRAIACDLNLRTERRITAAMQFEYVHRRRLAPPNPYRVSAGS
jgi:hypothetical protein